MERSIKKSLVWFYSISLIFEREICICVCSVYIFKLLLPFSMVIYAHVKSVSRLEVYIEGEPCFWGNLHKYRRDRNNSSIYTGDMVKADTPPLVVLPPHITRSRGKKRKTSVMFLENHLIGQWFPTTAVTIWFCDFMYAGYIYMLPSLWKKMYHYLKRDLSSNFIIIHITYHSRLQVSYKTKCADNNNLQSLTPHSVKIQSVLAMNHVLELSLVDLIQNRINV